MVGAKTELMFRTIVESMFGATFFDEPDPTFLLWVVALLDEPEALTFLVRPVTFLDPTIAFLVGPFFDLASTPRVATNCRSLHNNSEI